jgi:hypothetical protein
MFIPRHPVVENQFCSYGAVTSTAAATGIGGVIAYAGSVVYLDSTADNEEAVVFKMASGKTPFGFLMQKVKTGYHQVHPTGFFMPGDLGSSDVIAQPSYNSSGAINGTKAVPVGVAHLGIYDTVHYTSESETGALLPGDTLYAAVDEAKVTNVGGGGSDDWDPVEGASPTSVGRVMKGASAAKATANIANTTLYPIRIKLLI